MVKHVLETVPTRSDAELKAFIARQPSLSQGVPEYEKMVSEEDATCHQVLDWFYCLRKFEERNLKQNFLEFWPGTGGRFWGYLRLNPFFYDEQGKGRHIWELTHAFCYTKVRGLGINRLYVTLTTELARANNADLVVANPRHVSMLVTLTNMGWRVAQGAGSMHSIRRIVKQGKTWYGNNPNARRLYYAQELRPFMQDGSMMMEKKIRPRSIWKLKLF